MKQYRYQNYQEYLRVQEETGRRKYAKGAQWANRNNIVFLADYIVSRYGRPSTGICHGTRSGKEEGWFEEALENCVVFGTEIAGTATRERTIQWDFHVSVPEWTNAADFVYTNSFDHAFDPAKALKTWLGSLKTRGPLLIEHSSRDERFTRNDPLAIQHKEFPLRIHEWTNGRAVVTDKLELPHVHKTAQWERCFVIEKTAQ